LTAKSLSCPVPFLRDLTLQDFPFLTTLALSESARDRRIWLRVASDHFVAAEPDDPQAIETFAEVMAEQLGLLGVLDMSKLGAASLFFLPSCPYGALDHHQTVVVPGAPVMAEWMTEHAGRAPGGPPGRSKPHCRRGTS